MATARELPPEPSCQPCEREDHFVTAIKWCTECEESLCSECDRFHRKNKSSKDHHVVDISCIDKFSAVVDQVCTKHSNLNLDLFCADHDELCCRHCMTEKHRSCQQLLPLGVASKNVRSSTLLGATMEDMDTLFQTFVTIETKINKEKKSVNEQKKIALKGVTAIETRMRQDFEDSVKKLRQEIDNRCSEYMQQMEKQAYEVGKQKDVYKMKKQDVQHIIEHGSECQIFLLAHHLKTAIAKERSMCEHIIKSIVTVDIKHTENQTVAITPACFGDISYKSSPLELSMKYQNAQVKETDKKKTLYFNSKFNFHSEKKLCIQGIAITEFNNVLICDENSYRVFLYSTNGQHLDTFKTKGQPFGICVLHGLGEAVVTLPYLSKIEFFSTPSMKSVRVVDCFSEPWGIADTGDEIVVGLRCQMQLFTRRGGVRIVINIPGLDDTSICYAFSVDTNRILASCQHFYDLTTDGKINYHHLFSGNRANGICVDHSKCIYIATTNAILRLSQDGKILDKNVLDNKYDYGDLWAISFNKNFTKLYASTDDGNTLTVFDFK